MGLFYFAGHGVQVEGRNYLIRVDANIEQEYEVADEALVADSVLRAMGDAENHLNIIILDACRNNPFARSFRSASRGLAEMPAPTGSLVSDATSPGSVAADGEGRNGLYTKHLLDAMQTPGRTLEQVFKQVRINVARDTSERQVPWELSSLTGDFYFRPGTPVAATLVAEPQYSSEGQYWATVKDSQSSAEYEAYLHKYPDGEYADVAVARRDQYVESPTLGAFAIGQGKKVALINPVYYHNTENRYATVAVRDFVAARTPFDVMEMNPATAEANRLNAIRGIASVYPDSVDLVFTSTIIKIQSRREANSNYKSSTANETNYGRKLFNSLSKRSFQYFLTSNVDVEVAVVLPKENRQVTHIERLEYKVPLTKNVNEQELMDEAPITASVDALQAAMLKFELPVLPEAEQEEEPQEAKIFNSIFKSVLKQ